jgi:hypothetical protein
MAGRLFGIVAQPRELGRIEDLADGCDAARIERQADVAQLVEQLIRNQ